MLNNGLFLILPYLALALLIFVTPYRYFSNRLTWTAYSTQFLERERLFFGSNPWHYGIIPILLAHLLGFLFPGPFKTLLGHPKALVGLECIGLGLGLLALFGGLVLLLRRGTSSMLKRVTVSSDWVLLFLIAVQSFTGVYMALFMSWGSLWYLHAAAPYLQSLFTLNPDFRAVADLPLIFKLHVAGAFLMVGLLPFTKLVHLLYSPIAYLREAPIPYRWRSPLNRSNP